MRSVSRPKHRLAAFALAGASLLGAHGAVQAAAITVGTWYEFGFGGVGSALTSGTGTVALTSPSTTYAPDPAWTFTIGATGGQLFVTDAFQSGDRFEIFNNSVSMGLTSAPTLGSSCGSVLNCALVDSNFSKAFFALAPGSYSITGTAVLSPFGGGAGAFRVVENPVKVPEPAPLALLGIGLLAALGWKRQRSAG